MWAQLTKACLRLEEIETQLSQPETYDDPDLAASLNKEQKDLLPLVEAYRQHQKAQSDLDGLADLLDDPECRQLAKAEETALRAELDRLEQETKLFFQPVQLRAERRLFGLGQLAALRVVQQIGQAV